uniref:TetR family transcriptional regulator n=1 Tax=Parastrongyloides trichosuri TaxID=131310 RepID=A0A0N5A079_PARTI
MGTVGENNSLEPEEKRAVLKAAVEVRTDHCARRGLRQGRRGHRRGRPDGASGHGLCAHRGGARGALPRRGGRQRPAEHAVQQPADVPSDAEQRRPAPSVGRAEHRRPERKRPGFASHHRHIQRAGRPLFGHGRPGRCGAGRHDSGRQGLGLGSDQRLPRRVGGPGQGGPSRRHRPRP